MVRDLDRLLEQLFCAAPNARLLLEVANFSKQMGDKSGVMKINRLLVKVWFDMREK